MQIAPKVTFRNMQGSDAVRDDVRRRVEKLERFCPSIVAARVLIEPSGRHRRAGNRYVVKIDLRVPGEEIAISHQPELRADARALSATATRKQDETRPTRKELGVAVRDAFDAARRRLQDHVRRQRGV